MRPRLSIIVAFLGLGLALGCGGGGGSGNGEGSSTGGMDTGGDPSGPNPSTTTSTEPEDGTSSGSTGGTDGVDPPPPPTSPKANLQFKGPQRIEADLAAVLELDPETVCIEVGGSSCTRAVHRVALGGVAPYDLGIYEPTPLGATAPIAVDRVVWRACQSRIDLDLQGAAPVLFDVPLAGDAVADVDGEPVEAFIDGLYTRGLLRHPEPNEIDALRELYGDIAATSDSAPGRSWAIATCFATLTTAEFLFY